MSETTPAWGGTFSRPSEIPLVACPICGGAHRPEAVPISFAESAFERYLAGMVVCPVDAGTPA